MFIQRLRELRKENKVSQAALAKHLGLSQQAIGKWETGCSTPDPMTIREIARFFGVSIDYLLGVSDVRQIMVSPQTNLAPEDLKKQFLDAVEQLTPEEFSQLEKYTRYMFPYAFL